MKYLGNHLFAIALLMPAVATAHEKEVIGQFTALDRSTPGCGIFFFGSMASFATEDGQSKISLVVPCIEMQKVKMQSGQEKPLELHKMYRILVSPVRPENMDWPSASPELLYLIETREVAQPAA